MLASLLMTHRSAAAAAFFLLLATACAQTNPPSQSSRQSPTSAKANKEDPRIATLLDLLGKTTDIPETALSPDGSTLAWITETAAGTAVAAQRMGGGAPATLAAGPCERSGLAWSADSKRLAYLENCGSIMRVMTTDAALKTTRKVAEAKGRGSALRFAPKGSAMLLLFVANATRQAGALAAMKPPSGVIGVDDLEVQRLARIDPPAGAGVGKVTEISPANLHVYEYDVTADGTQAVYTAAAPPGENNWWIAEMYTQPLNEAAKPTMVWKPARPEEQIAVPRWSPDGSQIAYIGGLMSDQGATGGDVFLLPATGGTARNLTPGRKASAAWLAWPTQQQLLVSEIAGGATHVTRLDSTTGKEIAGRDFTLNGTVHASPDEQSFSLSGEHVAYVLSDFDQAPEVWAGESGHATQITHVNRAEKSAWGRAESVHWKNDGYDLQGWLLAPANFSADAAKKYPLIVAVHGGPASAVLPHWPQIGYTPVAFSALDYFVFLPNPRGSYGQGEKFAAANRKDFGYGDLRDILAGLDAVEQNHPIDDHRVGITGWSYGGFMTMFAVTQTQRFKAAVAGAGISNWQSYYGENSIDQWMVPYFGATVYDDPTVYARMSAINYIKQAKTPTLVVVGDRDGECPAPQSFEFWHALRAQGTPTELVVYPNEGHHFASREHQRDVLSRALQWFEHYMP